jgi:predicted regulator of Ras-like GTPase activity (Roadblock/LC7/MglB family)
MQEVRMPRFYFYVREDGQVIRDHEGLTFETLDAAEHAAVMSAAEIGRDRFRKGDVREITVEIRDENHFLLTTASVSMIVRRTARALA